MLLLLARQTCCVDSDAWPGRVFSLWLVRSQLAGLACGNDRFHGLEDELRRMG